MTNSQTNFYELHSREYIDWIIDVLNSEPSQMITEKTYSNILENGSDTDKLNILQLNNFASTLNSYARNNYINTFNVGVSDLEYLVHFSLVLKVDSTFLLIEYASSTYNSYTFISTFNNSDNLDYIDWDLYSSNKPPKRIEKIINELDTVSSQLNCHLQNILDNDLFKGCDLSEDSKKELITKFVLNNLELN